MTDPQDTHAPLTHFAVTAHACPQLLGRLTGLIAQQGLIPAAINAFRRDDLLLVAITQDGLDDQRAAVLEQKMRAIVAVRTVERLRYSQDRATQVFVLPCRPKLI